ncbi:MAG: phenylacetic acid degradation operon negative regulatory protein PaaX [Betaproteobacteria bacterium]
MPAAAPPPDPHVRRWIRRQLDAAPPRAPSLIVTVWGDAIVPHGGAVMLPGLIQLLAALGINERLVRTSVFRLAREGWLVATPVGRRSLYRLTREGERRFEQAHRRIYAPPRERWDDTWELVVAAGLGARQRRALEDELRWEGFGTLAAGTYARPSRDEATVARIGTALGIADRLVAARARDDEALGIGSLAAAVPRAWDLAAVGADYRRFLQRFGAVIERFRERAETAHDPEQCFVVRTLLIHDYRRVLLRDPQLPAALLPLDWPGAAAYALCRDFYRLTHRSADRHLVAMLEDATGELPPATAAFLRRFGGLESRAPAAR